MERALSRAVDVLLCSFHHHVVHRNGWTNHFDGTTYTITNQHGIKIE